MLVVNSKGKRSKQLLRKMGDFAFGIRVVDYNKGGKEILQGIVKDKELPVIVVNTHNGWVKTSKFKFGKISDTLPAGNMGEHVPLTQWSAYAYDANRGGNADGCSDWLFKDRPASMRAKYGKFHKYGNALNSGELYNKRGKDGFNLVPRSIYGSGNVFLHDYTQNSQAPLPRPYGPRDQAHLRGFPRFGAKSTRNATHNTTRNAINTPDFIPHPERTYKTAYTNYANDSLYIPGFAPSERENKQLKSTIAKINQKRMLGMGTKKSKFGMQPLSYGPNNVGYENPFLMYDGAGGNTINYLTGKNYLPSCTDRTFNKVQKNNNPTGYLASFGRKRTKRARFGENNWSTPSGPWVMKNDLRPQTTALINPTAGVTSDGPTRIAQPLKLYAYQNTPLASDKYPEFLGARSWYGGYGKKKVPKIQKHMKKEKKELKSEKKVLKTKKKTIKQMEKELEEVSKKIKEASKHLEKNKKSLKKKSKYGKNIFDVIANIKEGDTIDIKNGKLSIKE